MIVIPVTEDATTVTNSVVCFPFEVVRVMVAEPTVRPTMTPVFDTVAMAGAEDVNVTVLFVVVVGRME